MCTRQLHAGKTASAKPGAVEAAGKMVTGSKGAPIVKGGAEKNQAKAAGKDKAQGVSVSQVKASVGGASAAPATQANKAAPANAASKAAAKEQVMNCQLS